MTSDAIFRDAITAVTKCFAGSGEVAPARSREFYTYVAEQVLDVAEREIHVLCPALTCPCSFDGPPFHAEWQLIQHFLVTHLDLRGTYTIDAIALDKEIP